MYHSPISKISLDGREFLVKRDDLADKYLSGNKFRKLHTLLHTDKTTYKRIISYGGTQSNAMLAIAAMCAKKGWQFLYYTKPIGHRQKENNCGNFYLAKKLGMQHLEIDENLYRSFIASLHIDKENQTYVIQQGGADRSARDGLMELAKEIDNASCDVKSLATPSATGTTALYLALALPEYKVYTTPCVGDATYLRTQMSALETIPKNLIILESKKKYHFAKPYREFLMMYNRLKSAGIEFDLLYAPAMWMALEEQTDEEILYIHSGGISGNESMLQRYKKFSL